MKKHVLLKIYIVISLLFGAYTFLNQLEQKHNANETFEYSLYEVEGCFSVDYAQLDEEDKISYYMKAVTNLDKAIYILPATSYANVRNSNPDFMNALSGLYRSITIHSSSQSTNRLRAFTEKEHDIAMCLHYISMNPNDIDNSKKLTKITEELGY